MRATLDRLLSKVGADDIRGDIARMFNYNPDDDDDEDDDDDDDDDEADAPAGGGGEYELKLQGGGQPSLGGRPGGGGFKLNLDLHAPSN